MEILNKREENKYCVSAIVILTVLMLVGNIAFSDKIRVFGMVLTAYRVIIPLFFLFFLTLRFKQKRVKDIADNRVLISYLGFMAIWIIWGIGLLLLSPYVDLHKALQDLLSLLLGMVSIYCFWELCDTTDKLETVFHCIRIICILLCIWALVEILTGVYLPFSKYFWLDKVERKEGLLIILQKLKNKSVYPSTALFFNMNDLSSFLAVFLPLFYVNKKNSRKKNVLHGIGFFLLVFVISVNDSNIALIGIVVSVIVYFLAGEKKYAGGMLAALLTYLFFLEKQIVSIIMLIKSHLPINISSATGNDVTKDMISIEKMHRVTEVIETQVADAMYGSANSLMCRWEITLSSLRMTIKSKLMGVGPGGFEKYIEKWEKESKLVNPHNWWLEILSQYGLIIFSAYVIIMAYIFFRVCRIYKNTRSNMVLVYLCMCITFCFACIAPSNYLNYTYQWILPAIGIVIIGFEKKKFKDKM